MKFLLIDTSTERGIIAFFDGENLLFHRDLPYGYQNSKYLLPGISEGLQKCQLKLSDLAFIASTIGPGSYTGMRVSATVAKSLSLASQIPLVGVGTLDGFVPAFDTAFLAMIDAKTGGVYLKRATREKGEIADSPSQVCSVEEAASYVGVGSVIVSPNATRLKGLFGENLHWIERHPDPKYLGEVALDRFSKGQFSQNQTLDLIYRGLVA